jgi:hypothetical protein
VRADVIMTTLHMFVLIGCSSCIMHYVLAGSVVQCVCFQCIPRTA